MNTPCVIFATDDGHLLHQRKKFLRYVDNLIAVGKVQYCEPCIGMWDRVLETSYLMSLQDFNTHIKDSGFTSKQECFLVVPGDVRQPCTMLYQDGTVVALGPMVEGYNESMASQGWTYVESSGKYYMVAG